MESKKILVVDDEDVTLALLERILSEAGYEVMAVNNGQSSIKKSKSFLPDLILMDILLPDIDGAEAAKRIQEDPLTKNIEILFISSIATLESEDSTTPPQIKVGDTYYDALPKPIDAPELLSKIRKLLN